MMEKLLNCALVACVMYCIFTLITILGSFAKIIPTSWGLPFLIITVGFVTAMVILMMIVILLKTRQ